MDQSLSEIVEEAPEGKKSMNGNVDKKNFKVIENYIKRERVESSDSDHLLEPSFSAVSNGGKNRCPFIVTIPRYQETASGFFEFKIMIKYLEGEKVEWEIFRRYSDFQELHYLL